MEMGANVLLASLIISGLFFLTSAQLASPAVCGINEAGIEATWMGTIRDQAGEAKLLVLVDLAETDASLLDMPLPPLCTNTTTEEGILSFCKAVQTDMERWKNFLHHSPLPELNHSGTDAGLASPVREKRQLLALGMAATALAGFLGGLLGTGHPDLSELMARAAALQLDLDEQTAAVGVRADKIGGVFKLTAQVADHVGVLREDLGFLDTVKYAVNDTNKHTSQMMSDLAEVMRFQSKMDAVKDTLGQHQRLAAQRYMGLIDAQAHRLSAAVVSPPIFARRLLAIEKELLQRHRMHVSFGKAEAAYEATRVDMTVVKSAQDRAADGRLMSQSRAGVLCRTPYFDARPPPAQLYRLRSHPVQATAFGDASRVQAQLKAHYIAVRGPQLKPGEESIESGEYYQLLSEEDVRDTGNGTFLNTRPSSFDWSADAPSCEYAVTRKPKDATVQCLKDARPVKSLRNFVTLESGCWLMEPTEPAILEKCDGPNGEVTRPITLPLHRPSLMRPRCACRYNSHAREYPVSNVGCEMSAVVDVQLPILDRSGVNDILKEARKTFDDSVVADEELEAEFRILNQTLSDDETSIAEALGSLQLVNEDYSLTLAPPSGPTRPLGLKKWQVALFWGAIAFSSLAAAYISLSFVIVCCRRSRATKAAVKSRMEARKAVPLAGATSLVSLTSTASTASTSS